MKRIASALFGVAVFCLASTFAGAGVNVGDTPKVEFKAVDGSAINAAALKGKIVVVDFWATWCGPCMAEADHMVAINEKYHAEGMQFIGISLDADKAAMIQIVKEKKFAWPQYFDGKGWQNQYATEWGVKSIPRTFILSPEGSVLWTGHPAQIDAPLAQAFKDHPPFLVDPKVLASANAALDAAEAAIKKNDPKTAIAAMGKVSPEAKADKTFAARADSVRSQLNASADELLKGTDAMIAAGQYADAITRLKDLSTGLEGSPASASAKKKLMELSSKPEVKSALAKVERNKAGQVAFDVAQRLKDEKKDELAYARFKAVAHDFADTEAGPKAAAAAAEYEKDPEWVKKANDSAASTRATSLMKLAQSYASAGRNDLARQKYQEIVTQFPGTTYAAQAQKAIASLPK